MTGSYLIIDKHHFVEKFLVAEDYSEGLFLLAQVESVRNQRADIDLVRRDSVERSLPVVLLAVVAAVPCAPDCQLLAQNLPVAVLGQCHVAGRVAHADYVAVCFG